MIKVEDLTIAEARELYNELHKIFGGTQRPEMMGTTGLEHLLSRQRYLNNPDMPWETPCTPCEPVVVDWLVRP